MARMCTLASGSEGNSTYISNQDGAIVVDIGVTYKVISVGLMEAIIAGMGPDIAGFSSSDAITWGIRDGVQPLNDFEGFD